jgi:hypothetical protein
MTVGTASSAEEACGAGQCPAICSGVSCEISGGTVPNCGAGSYTFSVEADDGHGGFGTASYSLLIACTPVTNCENYTETVSVPTASNPNATQNLTVLEEQDYTCRNGTYAAGTWGTWHAVGECTPNNPTTPASYCSNKGGGICVPTWVAQGSCPSCGGGSLTFIDTTCGSSPQTVACNTPACCTTDWQESSATTCSGTCGGGGGSQTITMTDYGSCNSGSYSFTQNCTNSTPCCTPQYTDCGACSQSTGQKTCADATCGTGTSRQVACTYGPIPGSTASCTPYNLWVPGLPPAQQGACAQETGSTFLTCGAVGDSCPSKWSGKGYAAGAGNPADLNCSGGTSECDDVTDSQGSLDEFSCCGYY